MPNEAIHIVLEVEGPESESGDVRLTDFLDQLHALKAAFDSVDKKLERARHTNVDYRIVAATRASPLKITIEPFRKLRKHRPSSSLETVHAEFFRQLKSVADGQVNAEDFDNETLEAFNKLANPSGRINTVISNHTARVSLDAAFRDTIESILAHEIYSHGSVTGRLEAINLHGEPAFWLYPNIGPIKVLCKFSVLDKQKAKDAIERVVRVHGRKAFRAGAKFPYRVDVKTFEAVERPPGLGGFADLRGAGGSSETGNAADYIRELRDEW